MSQHPTGPDQPEQPPQRPDQPQQPPPYGQQPPPYGQQPPPYGQQPPPYGQQPGGYQAYPGAGAPPAGGYTNELSPADQRMWSMLAHLGAILFSFLAPLVVYLVMKDRGPFVREQSREALNFNITLAIGYVVGAVLTTVFIGGLVMFALGVLNIVFPILAAIAVNKGENYRYPFAWRIVT